MDCRSTRMRIGPRNVESAFDFVRRRASLLPERARIPIGPSLLAELIGVAMGLARFNLELGRLRGKFF